MPPLRSASAGYSLLELMVVLAIMSLIVVVAIPYSAGTVEKFSLASDTRQVATGLRAWRQRAVDMQRDIAVAVTTEPAVTLKTSEGDVLALSSGTTASVFAPANRTTVVLSWDGSISGTIVLARGGKSSRVFADKLNGPIRVEAIR